MQGTRDIRNGMTTRIPIDWDSQPLGEVPDLELAKRLGVSRTLVGQQRRRRGIESHRQKYGLLGIDWSRQPLGSISDRKLARDLGVSFSLVQYRRKALGIPAPSRRRGNHVQIVVGQDAYRLLVAILDAMSRGADTRILGRSRGFGSLVRDVKFTAATTEKIIAPE